MGLFLMHWTKLITLPMYFIIFLLIAKCLPGIILFVSLSRLHQESKWFWTMSHILADLYSSFSCCCRSGCIISWAQMHCLSLCFEQMARKDYEEVLAIIFYFTSYLIWSVPYYWQELQNETQTSFVFLVLICGAMPHIRSWSIWGNKDGMLLWIVAWALLLDIDRWLMC